MIEKRKRDPVARWNAALAEANDLAPDAEAKRLLAETLAMTDDEIERALVQDGVDLAALGARAGAAFDAFMAKTTEHDAPASREEDGAWVAPRAEPEAAVLPRRDKAHGKRVRRIAFTAIAAAATASAATYIGTRPPPETPDVKPDAAPDPTVPAPKVTPTADPMAEAAKLRGRALAACAKGEFAECLGGLDAARELDPEGENAVAVQEARVKASQALGKKRPK